MFKTDPDYFKSNALVIGFLIQTPMIAQVFPVNGMILPLKKDATEGTDEGAIVLDSEGPAIE